MSPLKQPLRSLRHRPAYALLWIALLAIGVGTASAIFSIVDVALLRPLPYLHPERLLWLQVHEPSARDSGTSSGLVPLQLVRWRAEHQQFDGIEGAEAKSFTLTGLGDPQVLTGLQVSAGLFGLLGATPARGRGFNEVEEFSGSGVMIVSHAFWQLHLGGDSAVVGRTLVIDGAPRTVVGVMRPNFSVFFVPADFYLPLPLEPALMASTYRAIMAVGRVKPGVSPQQAVSSLDRVNDAIAVEAPFFRRSRATVQPLREALFGPTRTSLLVMVAAVALLLLIAGMNAMNLALSDATARRQATVTRLALGARPAQILIARGSETAILVAVAASSGFLLGRAMLRGLQAVNPAFFDGFGALGVDGRVALFTLTTAGVVGALAVLPAAVAESRFDVNRLAGTSARAVGSKAEHRTRELLLASQVAIAVVLLFAASLLARNLRSLGNAPQGFDAAHLLAVKLPAPSRYPKPEERARYMERLAEAVGAVPGVSEVSASQVQFSLGSSSRTFLAIDGVSLADSAGIVANIRHVMPAVFSVMRTKVLEGRAIDATDREGAIPVAVVNASFARLHLGGHAIGARVRRTASPAFQWMQVVGVVEDAKDAGLGIPLGPTIYVPYLQENQPTVTMTVLARLRDGTSPPERAIRRAIVDLDPLQAINRIALVDDLERESTSQPRFQALVVMLFGVGALLLVVGGIYAVTWHTVLRRTRELGLRSALGASPVMLLTDSIWRGLRPVSIGIAAGLLIAYPAVRLMQRALNEEIQATDLALLGYVLIVVIGAAGCAALIPARRALRIAPATALQA